MMSGTIFKRDRRWKIKRSLVSLTKDRLAARTKNGEIPIRACCEQETEIDHVTQTKYTQELINRTVVLPIHYDVRTSFNHSLLCEEIICKRKSLVSLSFLCLDEEQTRGAAR
ncbi:uncharacterized protein LOC131015055 isoform X2 [Salvia miltiorrhiza]|uniref:uncharacterized protein LOC131015055 isoform X2 n=1 Tax=Salvia miltiorrhiza TaxID=226208 RepID=UPI0025ACDD8A|nr:uncharacterized protein LOC131015055 isoform X2 [Salvia miltiorrhiza]XP_057799238.1 uncharacterized protein LOC131015055 isoform X2 [Salvia miltiorrhiza]